MRSILPFAAFFLSGASSLVFQTLWTRLLHHVFGATSVATSSVLTVFMAGLGLGAYAFGRWGDRIRRPLLAYAYAEVVVGLCGLAIPLIVQSDGFLAGLNALLREHLGASSFAFMLARFAAVVPILIVPTTLMGATLPLLARHFVAAGSDAQRIGANVGALYAVNTLGAVFGTAMAAFVWMPDLGVRHTNLLAAGTNLALGATIWTFERWVTGQPSRQPDGGSRERAAPAVADTVRPAPRPRPEQYAVLWAFAASGACALGYEVVWSRALSMAIGSSVHSFALILETFLVGIALGSAALSPLLTPLATPLDPSLRGRLRAAPALRVAALAACLLCPVAHADAAVRRGLLTFGVAVTLSWGCIALIVAFGLRRLRDAAVLEVDAPPSALLGHAFGCLAVPFAGAALHALSAVTLESSYAGVSIHGHLPYIALAVVTLIAAFVALIAGLWRRTLLLAAVLQLYVGLSTFGTYLFQDEIPYTFARLVSALSDLPEHVAAVRFFMFFTAALCTLPATLGMGAMFPLTLRVWSRGGERVAADVGTVYTSNTLGSIVGAWLPGFVLMPWIGMQRTLLLGVSLNLLAALWLCVAEDRSPAERHLSRWPARLLSTLLPPLAAALYFAVTAQGSPLRWNLAHMTLGAFRVSLANDVLDPQSWGEPDIVYYRDGVSTTVSVERWGSHLSMKNNGKVDASNGDDMPTQIMVAAYPLLLHPEGPRDLDVALIGFGSGVTVGAALQFPVAHVDVVELEASVVEAALKFFGESNHLPRNRATFPYVSRPRLSVHADDGRNFLAASSKQYDVIISEPSNPWITGVSDLFTVEHFELTKQRLVPGGVYCQWVQLYELSPTNVKIIYRTFARHFRHVAVFAAAHGSSDTILVGSDAPLPLSLEHVRQSMVNPETRRELARAHVDSAHDVFARTLFASRREVMTYAHIERRRVEEGTWEARPRAHGSAPCPRASCRRTPAPLNTDDNMRIEFAAPRDLIGFEAYSGYVHSFYDASWPYGDLFAGWAERGMSAEDAAGMALSLVEHGRVERAARFADHARARARTGSSAARVARVVEALRTPPGPGWPSPGLEPPVPGPQLDAATRRTLRELYDGAVDALRQQRYAAALRTVERIPTPLRLHSGPALRLLYGYVLWRGAEGDRTLLRSAVTQLDHLVRREPDFVAAHPETHFFAARAQLELGEDVHALRAMRAYIAATAATQEPDASPPVEPRTLAP